MALVAGSRRASSPWNAAIPGAVCEGGTVSSVTIAVARSSGARAWIDGALYLEVHPSTAQGDQLETRGWFDAEPEDFGNVVAKVRAAAGTKADRLDFKAIWRAVREKRGYPVRITR